MDWNESSRRLAVWNLSYGVDIYTIEGRQLGHRASIPLKIRVNYAIQVRFVDEDTLAVGSDSGAILLLNIPQRAVTARLRHVEYPYIARELIKHLGRVLYTYR